MNGVTEYGRVPFLTEQVPREHKVFEQADDRFRAAVRARQALLREQKGWDIGLPPAGDTQREIGCASAQGLLTSCNNNNAPKTIEKARLSWGHDQRRS